MTKPPILLVGAGGHARACIDIIEEEECFTVFGLIGLTHEVGRHVFGYPVIGTDKDLVDLFNNCRHALVAVGQIKTPEPRVRLFDVLDNLGFVLPVVVSPRAHVSRHAKVGAGTIVMHGAVVNAGAVIGRNCIINTQSLVEHDVVVGDHCHISTSAAINSGVCIDAGTFFGSNSSARQSVRIGERCVIGMGQRVLTDCQPGAWVPPRKRKP